MPEDGLHRLLLHGIDTLQCAYYLHQERPEGFDFGQLLQTREQLRQVSAREGSPVILGAGFAPS